MDFWYRVAERLIAHIICITPFLLWWGIARVVSWRKENAAQQSFAADGVVGSPVYGATSHCTVCKKRIVYSEDGWLHCEPQDHGFARPDEDIQNPPRR